MRIRLSFLLTFALVLLRKDGVAKPLRAICGSGAGDFKGRDIAGVLAEFYGDQVDRMVKADLSVYLFPAIAPLPLPKSRRTTG